ncbi:MAG TPA: bifunctional adenosylcobinamide kinase/adenosylcobinamide-phosphate guanylyltransferase [Candidatus Binataceae bacterium]|jgi:adenosyl cobinamide kinase/adenosyl cobinamide phosphate guanylyltransferase|nr:bifunctional adenosylcobinamide kinase/adenosylcobinamide-phosphate guanylyltransferase [Candidatus Binataceae bacterium]
MGAVTLITGGARSGKSAHALALAEASGAARRFFVATAEPLDDEMRERIAHHRAHRPTAFATVEEPIAIAAALVALEGRADLVIIDCVTLWISNLMLAGRSDDAIAAEARALADVLAAAGFESLVVSGEVGAGIVPENATARRFRDLLGWANQAVAQVAQRVVLMVAGCPLRVK